MFLSQIIFNFDEDDFFFPNAFSKAKYRNYN